MNQNDADGLKKVKQSKSILCKICKGDKLHSELEIRHRMCADCDDVNLNASDYTLIKDIKNAKYD